MRKKLIYGLLAGSVLAAMLTGCGDGSEEGTAGTSSEVAVISPEPALSDTEREMENSTHAFSFPRLPGEPIR